MKFLKWFADNSVNPIHVLMALLVRVFADSLCFAPLPPPS